MLNARNIINAINKSLEPFFIKGHGGALFLDQQKSLNIFRLRITEESSMGYDNYGNSGEYVNVVKWFSDFWLFVEISFIQPKGAIITLSVFQGEETDSNKVQLFRAEWDDYGDGSTAHAQPHWHFLTNRIIENTVSSFAEMTNTQDTFEQLLIEEKNKVIDLSKFHFAMNGDWNNSTYHVHQILDELAMAKWFGGLLAYMKTELEYIDAKRSGV